MKKSRKLAWVVLGVVGCALVALLLGLWPVIAYEEAYTLTATPPSEYGFRIQYVAGEESLFLYDAPIMNDYSGVKLFRDYVSKLRWPIDRLIVMRHRFTGELHPRALDAKGDPATPVTFLRGEIRTRYSFP